MMKDPHLNLFYSYNQDAELIENNLTRALIVTLRALSPPTRHSLLTTLLMRGTQRRDLHAGLDLGEPILALQAGADRELVRSSKLKRIIVLSSSRFSLASREVVKSIEKYDSVPDAWIISSEGEYCFLIEAKVGGNPVNSDQLMAHANSWLGLQDSTKFADCLISLTWDDVVDALADSERSGRQGDTTPQELHLLHELETFLGYFGHRAAKPLRFDDLLPSPTYSIAMKAGNVSNDGVIGLGDMGPAPRFRIGLW